MPAFTSLATFQTVLDGLPMIDIVAELCEVNKSQINIKGKTTEKLGVVGKENAIACEVITSVIKYD